MEPRLAHILTVLFLTFSLHLIDRQVSQKSHSRKIFLTLFVNELTFMNIYSGRVLEQAGLSMETSVNKGTGRSVSHEKRQQASTS